MENFNDKFLNVCFKLGKVIFSALLLLALIVTVILWVNTGVKFVKEQSIQMTYKYESKPVFEEFAGIKKQTTQKETTQKETTEKSNKKALDILAEFAKAEAIPQNIIDETFVLPVGENESISYVNGFIDFYKSFFNDLRTYAKNEKKVTDTQIDNALKENKIGLYTDILSAYSQQYQLEVEKVTNQKTEIQTQMYANLTAALVSLAIFILFLFLPILIRIEENTRK